MAIEPDREAHAPWTLALVVGACLLMALILGAHLLGEQQLTAHARKASDVRKAADEARQASLHLVLGRTPGTPWDHAQGLALLDQSGAMLERCARELDEPELAGQLADVTRALRQAATSDPGPEGTATRLAIHRLSLLVSELDVAVATSAQRIAGRTSWQFNTVIVLGAALMAAIGLSLMRMQRSRDAAQAELASHQNHLAELVERRTAELSQALAAREQAENFAQMLTDVQPTLLAFWDSEPRLRFANRAYLEWFGLKREVAIGQHAVEIFGECPTDRYRATRPDLEGGQTQSVQANVKSADGRVAQFLSHRIPYRVDGELRGHFYVATDVSELTDTRAALAQVTEERVQIERFAALVTDNIPARIAYWDRDLRLRYGNRRFCERSGQPLAQLLGRHFEDLFGPARLHAARERIDRVLGGAVEVFEREETDTTGSTVTMQLNYVPDWHEGQVRGLVVLALDVTEARQGERALRSLNDELSTARDRAESATRAKSAFLANMSHEIRTPLNAVLGLTHLMLREAADGRQLERLHKIDDAGRHLLQVINDILDLSKIEAGKLQLHAARFRLDDLVARCLGIVGPAAAAKGLDLRVDTDHVASELRGDATLLAQAIINLLGNAIKFTERGWVSLSVRLLTSESTRMLLKFEISDTGIGVPREAQEHLFRAFEQGDNTVTRRFGGSGLGLALTRSIARLMSGDTGLRSHPGEGSSFWFTAWIEDAGVAGSADTPARTSDWDRLYVGLTQDQSHAVIEQLRRVLGGHRVLLAEDNLINQEVAVEVLHNVGLEVRTALNGSQAVALALAEPFDAVLMDMQMPVMDGLAATREIRRQLARPLPIIAMTANAFAEDRATCLAAGMDDHVGKPVDPAVLYQVLMRWIAPTPAAQAPSDPTSARAAAAGRQPDTIEGIDLAAALRHAGGNRTLLWRLLDRFCADHAAHDAALRLDDDALARDRMRQHCHSLRGACATIGASELAEQLQALERDLKDPGRADETLRHAVLSARERLEHVVRAIQAAPRPAASPPGPVS